MPRQQQLESETIRWGLDEESIKTRLLYACFIDFNSTAEDMFTPVTASPTSPEVLPPALHCI